MHEDATTGDGGVALARRTVIALLACGIFPTFGLFSPGLILPQMAEAFAGTDGAALKVEMLVPLAGFTFAIGAALAGGLIARKGCRAVLVPALAVFALAGAAPAVLDDLWAILASRAVLGVALSGIFTAALVGIGAQRSDLRMSLFGWFAVVGGSAAVVMFPMIGLLGRLGWRLPFLINLLALPAILLALGLPRVLGIAARRPKRAAGGEAPAGRFLGLGMVFLLMLATMIGMSMLISPIYAPLYLTSLGITDTRLLAIPPTLGAILAVATSAAYGRAYRAFGLYGHWAVCLLTMGTGLVIAGTSTNVVVFTGAIVIASSMVAAMAPNLNATAMAVSPPHLSAQAIGLANGVMFGGQLVFPLFATWLRGIVGLGGVFVLFGLLLLVVGTGVACGVLLNRRRRAFAGSHP